MAANANFEAPTPVICVDPSSVAGADTFNPNSWFGGSKGVIQSCWTEYSVLHHCVDQISGMCDDAKRVCAKNIETIQQQWLTARFDVRKMVFFGQQPDLHIRIEAFFSGVKTLLDLVVQLLSTEKIVSEAVDGFHRAQNVYGGRVLNALRNNAMKNKKDAANKLDALVSEQKKLWIDQVILARDQLIHPEKGMHQLMFHLDFAEKDNVLECVKVSPPEIDGKPVHLYAQEILRQVTVFSTSFLRLVR
jgi:hypothetical protein